MSKQKRVQVKAILGIEMYYTGLVYWAASSAYLFQSKNLIYLLVTHVIYLLVTL